MPSQLISACSTMVSSVDPDTQRIQPSSTPKPNTCPITNQSYCTCISAKTTDVRMIASHTSFGSRKPPRKKKTAKKPLFADGRDNHDREPQQRQPAPLGGRRVNVVLERGDQVAPGQPAHNICKNDEANGAEAADDDVGTARQPPRQILGRRRTRTLRQDREQNKLDRRRDENGDADGNAFAS